MEVIAAFANTMTDEADSAVATGRGLAIVNGGSTPSATARPLSLAAPAVVATSSRAQRRTSLQLSAACATVRTEVNPAAIHRTSMATSTRTTATESAATVAAPDNKIKTEM